MISGNVKYNSVLVKLISVYVKFMREMGFVGRLGQVVFLLMYWGILNTIAH